VRKLSRKLQDYLLEFINGKREFEGECEIITRLKIILLALGAELVKWEEKNENTCLIRVYYHAS
jgi:hypothetical protein